MAAVFSTAGRIITGRGAFRELAASVKNLGQSALIVTGKHAMRRSGVIQRTQAALSDAGCRAVPFDRVEPEPTIQSVDAGRELFRRQGCDVVVGIGGGSALDVAKAIGGLACVDEPCAAFFAGKPMPDRGAPVIAVPTTAGSGAEVTFNSVLTDPAGPLKQSIRGDGLLPAVAIVDPELAASLPPQTTARCGMDALTQAIEAYWSIHASSLTDALALQAIRLISANLVAAFDRGDNMEAREALSYGSLLAGMAFASARLGAVHGMAHPLGVRSHLPHGEVCAILLPHVMRLNRPASPDKYQRISEIVRADAADVAARLLVRLNLPTTFAHANLSPGDFPAIVAESMPSGSLKANPHKVTPEDILGILAAVS